MAKTRATPRPFKYRNRWRGQVTLSNGTRPHADFDTMQAAKDWITDTLSLGTGACRALGRLVVYQTIAGNKNNYSVMRAGGPPQGKNEQECDCDAEGVKRLVPVQSPQEQEEAERRAQRLRTAGKVVVAGGALAAIAAAASAAAEAAGPWLLGLLALWPTDLQWNLTTSIQW